MSAKQKAAQALDLDNAIDRLLDLDSSENEHPASQSKLPAWQENGLFSLIHQGPHTNEFAKMRASSDNMIIDEAGKATITQGILSAHIEKYISTVGFRTSTQMLFDILVETVTNAASKYDEFIIPLSDFMTRRGLTNRQQSKNQVSEDVEVLGAMSWVMREVTPAGNYQSTDRINLAQRAKVARNGDIIFHFTKPFTDFLLSLPLMPLPQSLFKINTHKNPSSYYFCRKAAEHKNMNMGKENENIISVKTLLKATPYIPSIERVRDTSRHFYDKIIAPFERDMDALEETFSWEYCKKHGDPLSYDEYASLHEGGCSYEFFENLLVEIFWEDYPDQTARLEKKERDKAKAIARAKRKKSLKKAPQPLLQGLFPLKE